MRMRNVPTLRGERTVAEDPRRGSRVTELPVIQGPGGGGGAWYVAQWPGREQRGALLWLPRGLRGQTTFPEASRQGGSFQPSLALELCQDPSTLHPCLLPRVRPESVWLLFAKSVPGSGPSSRSEIWAPPFGRGLRRWLLVHPQDVLPPCFENDLLTLRCPSPADSCGCTSDTWCNPPRSPRPSYTLFLNLLQCL